MTTCTPALWWHPDNLAARRSALAGRQAVLRAWRHWFETQNFDEVETPCLQVSPCVEVHMRGFKTRLEGLKKENGRELWLHTSPEFAMKKLLVGGMERIFQFARVFRNGESTERHQPEFTLLEWYRAQADYTALMADCTALLRLAAEATGRKIATWEGRSCDLTAEPEIVTVAEAFTRYCGLDIHSPRLEEEARAKGYRVAADDRWEDVFFRLMLDHIEPNLGSGRPTFLCEYPVSQAVLSRPKPGDERVAERFELYVAGLELANAYGELTDPVLQRQRFTADMDLRQQLYGERFPVDEDFLAALDFGLPPAAGIALGFDRMVMLATGATDIRQVVWSPVVEVMTDAVRPVDTETLVGLEPPSCADCIVMTHDGKILLQQRPENWGASAGRLTSFGGHLEEGETPLEGMRRELEEEVGAKIGAEEAVLVGIVTEDTTQHKVPLYVYFWHDRGGTITGCYECEAVYYDRIAGALAHPKIMPYLRWALLECQRRGLLP